MDFHDAHAAVVEHEHAAVLGQPALAASGPLSTRRLGAHLGLDRRRGQRRGLDDAGERGRARRRVEQVVGRAAAGVEPAAPADPARGHARRRSARTRAPGAAERARHVRSSRRGPRKRRSPAQSIPSVRCGSDSAIRSANRPLPRPPLSIATPGGAVDDRRRATRISRQRAARGPGRPAPRRREPQRERERQRRAEVRRCSRRPRSPARACVHEPAGRRAAAATTASHEPGHVGVTATAGAGRRSGGSSLAGSKRENGRARPPGAGGPAAPPRGRPRARRSVPPKQANDVMPAPACGPAAPRSG